MIDLEFITKNFFSSFVMKKQERKYMKPKIINNSLDAIAGRMVYTNVYGFKEGYGAIKEFLKAGNNKKMQNGVLVPQQGRALVAYYSELRKARKDFNPKFVDDLHNVIDDRVKATPELKEMADEFVSGLKKSYPKSLGDRIALASHGCVDYSQVKRQSAWKKFVVSLSKMIREA